MTVLVSKILPPQLEKSSYAYVQSMYVHAVGMPPQRPGVGAWLVPPLHSAYESASRLGLPRTSACLL